MAFKWKDRDGAVSQAAYQFRLNRDQVEADFRALTPEQLQEGRDTYGPDWKPTFGAERTLLDCTLIVLGGGDRFRNYFCVDPDNISHRQYTQFRNDVQRYVKRWDKDVALIAALEVQVASNA